MTFQDKFVAVVMTNGQILRERNGVVTLPFLSDYSLKLKNLNSQKASVGVSIDGQDVLNGSRLLIGPNSDTVLDGFLDGHEVKHQFRFIKKTDKIAEHRGDRLDDGIVRVEFAFEQPWIAPTIQWDWTYPEPPKTITPRIIYTTNTTAAPPDLQWQSTSSNLAADNVSCSVNARNDLSINPDEGITVRGADANQHFNTGYIGLTDEPSVITIKLRGTQDGTTVTKPIHTTTKLTCNTCGLRCKSSATFCSECGTRL